MSSQRDHSAGPGEPYCQACHHAKSYHGDGVPQWEPACWWLDGDHRRCSCTGYVAATPREPETPQTAENANRDIR